MERLKITGKEKLFTIEGVRELFVDPTGERKTELTRLLYATTECMQDIYKTEGKPKLYKTWLEESTSKDVHGENGIGDLTTVLGQILAREAGTRRFDNKFFGQIHPQGSEIGILSNFIAAFMNTNTVVKEVSIAENLMEEEALDWLAEMFGYDKDTFSGNIETGGTEANDTAFWVAREWNINELKKAGRDPSKTKLYVIGSQMKHYSIVKVCNKLGLDFVEAPQKDLKSDSESMREAISKLDLENGKVAVILGIAGGTETGMIDDLNALHRLALENNAHFHVDAAYGGPFILTREAYRFLGIHLADSITVDPHKMLYTPYASGVVLFKDRERHALITGSMLNNVGYLSPKRVRETADVMERGRNYGPSRSEGSMGSEGVISTWATMKLLGNEGVKTLLNHTLKLTDYAFSKVANSPVLTPLHQPETNTLLMSLRNTGMSIEENNKMIEGARDFARENGYYISTDDEIFKGRAVFRFVAMHPYSTTDNVDELIYLLESHIGTNLK